jgi:group I intron endonuclease
MCIYKITNVINNKIYIGQTVHTIQHRFQRHINDAINCNLNTHFARAIRKYGKESFRIEIIDTTNSSEELTAKERYWIHFYNSINYGYNETDAEYKQGGNTYKSKSVEEMNIIKDKIRITKIGSLNPNATKIIAINLSTGEEKVFGSQKECALYYGINGHSPVSKRCRNIIKTPLKINNDIYTFKYYNE